MPGYCVQGTVGHKILNGAKTVEIDRQNIQVKLTVEVRLFFVCETIQLISLLIKKMGKYYKFSYKLKMGKYYKFKYSPKHPSQVNC